MQAIFFEPPLQNNYLGHQIKEIYFDRVYASLIEGKGLKTCLDVGGNIGMTSYYFSHHFEQVITLEPSAEHFKILTEMLAYNKIENVKAINKALFIKEGEYPLFHPLNENKTTYSLHTGVIGGNQDTPSEKVQAITLKGLFEQEKIGEVDLLKLDIEGSEVEIFSHSDFKELAPRIRMIVAESHAWNGRNPNQLIDALKMAGYGIEKAVADANLIIAVRK